MILTCFMLGLVLSSMCKDFMNCTHLMLPSLQEAFVMKRLNTLQVLIKVVHFILPYVSAVNSQHNIKLVNKVITDFI